MRVRHPVPCGGRMTPRRPTAEPGPPHAVDAAASRQLVVIAASAGGLQPLIDVLAALPADFPAAVAVVQHRGEAQPNVLSDILRRRTALPVRDARDGDLLEPGIVYVCP